MVRLCKLHTIARGGSLSLAFRSSQRIFRANNEVSEVPNGAPYPKFHRGMAYAASFASEVPNKGRKRVPKDQRRAMVKSFVEKYRALNGGKFPTAMTAVKEVGGSFYVVREIIQELEYKSRTSRISNGIQYSSPKEQVKDSTPLTEVQEFTSTANVKTQNDMQFQSMASNSLRTEDACSNLSETTRYETSSSPEETLSDTILQRTSHNEREVTYSCLEEQMDDKQPEAQDDNSGSYATHVHFLKEESHEECKGKEQSLSDVPQESDNLLLQNTEEQSHSFHVKQDGKAVKALYDDVRDCHSTNEIIQEVDDKKDAMASKAFSEPLNRRCKTEYSSEFQGPEEAERGIPERQGNDSNSLEKSSLWGNLKSFVTDIVKMWRTS